MCSIGSDPRFVKTKLIRWPDTQHNCDSKVIFLKCIFCTPWMLGTLVSFSKSTRTLLKSAQPYKEENVVHIYYVRFCSIAKFFITKGNCSSSCCRLPYPVFCLFQLSLSFSTLSFFFFVNFLLFILLYYSGCGHVNFSVLLSNRQ